VSVIAAKQPKTHRGRNVIRRREPCGFFAAKLFNPPLEKPSRALSTRRHSGDGSERVDGLSLEGSDTRR